MGSQPNRRLGTGDSAVGASVSDTINIAVFDENVFFRAGIVQVLNAEPGMRVVATSDVPAIGGLSVDVAIIDAALITRHGSLAQAIQGFRWSTKVLVLAFGLDEEQVFATFAAGARGYVLKAVSGSELVAAVRALQRGEGYVSPSVGAVLASHGSLAKRHQPVADDVSLHLTFREAQIFDLLTSGLTNREIGCRLDVTEKTVKRYMTGIFEKLHVRNRVEAVMLSRQRPDITGAQRAKRLASISRAAILPLSPAEAGRSFNAAADARPTAGALLGSNGRSSNGHSSNDRSLHHNTPDQAAQAGGAPGERLKA